MYKTDSQREAALQLGELAWCSVMTETRVMGAGGREAEEGRNTCAPIADSHWGTAETGSVPQLSSNLKTIKKGSGCLCIYMSQAFLDPQAGHSYVFIIQRRVESLKKGVGEKASRRGGRSRERSQRDQTGERRRDGSRALHSSWNTEVNEWLLTNERIRKMWYIYMMEYDSDTKRDEMGSFVETWMDQELTCRVK